MPRKCTVCTHPKRKAIERAFIAGYAYRTIAHRFDIDRYALMRHITHVARRLWRRQRLKEAAAVESIGDIAAEALVEARGLLASAKRASDRKAWAAAVAAITKHAELLGRLEGRIKDTQVIMILDSPAWKQVEDRIFVALEDHPKARDSVARALMQLTDGRGMP